MQTSSLYWLLCAALAALGSADAVGCCPSGTECCGFECIPTTLVELGLPCQELAGGCCPEPMDNCCEEGSFCCDGTCFTFLTMSQLLEVELCGDLSCCDVPAFAPGMAPGMAPEMVTEPISVPSMVPPTPLPTTEMSDPALFATANASSAAPAPGPAVNATLGTRPSPPPPPTVAVEEEPERGFSTVYGDDEGYIMADPNPPSDPAIMKDEDVINEGINNCCPEGSFCCGFELGCIPEALALEVMCPEPPTDGAKPCCV